MGQRGRKEDNLYNRQESPCLFVSWTYPKTSLTAASY